MSAGRVLVVDDVESNRYVLATWLRRAGYEVVEAGTGGEALQLLVAQPFDLVVLDVHLPDMSGFVVCERIKADERTAALPVLHVSATSIEPASRSEGLRRGAEGYLIEPVDREVLLATVGALLRGAMAQRTATRLAARLRQLNEATLAINRAVTIEHVAATIVREAARLFASSALLAVSIEDRSLTATAGPHEQPLVATCTTEAVDAIRRAVGTGQRIPGIALIGLARSIPAESILVEALDDPTSHRAVLLVGEPPPPDGAAMSDESSVLLAQFARAAGTAIRNVRTFNIERSIALTLQRNLLPPDLPVIPGIAFAARYIASTKHAEVGGDFYDVFQLGSDALGLSIGDVVGHSLEAAAVMAQLRTGIRSYALEGHRTAGTMQRLNRLLRTFHPDIIATACFAIFDRSTGSCELANAGHPAPLVVGPNGSHYLPNGGPLLGVNDTVLTPHTFVLHPSETLLLFTDGLVERRGETIDDGLNRLTRAAERAHAVDLERLCDILLKEAGPTEVVDDIALMAVRPTS